MSSPVQGPPGGDRNRGPQLIAAWWTQCAIVTVMVILRFYTRIMIGSLGADDWMMFVNVIVYMVTCSFVTYLASIGGCRHLFYLKPSQALEAVKYNWIAQVFGLTLFATGKAAAALLILRIIGPKTFWRKWILWIVIGSAFIANGATIILSFVQCNPPRALWTPSIPSHCWSPEVNTHFAVFSSTWNIFLDVVLATLSISIFWNLNMARSKRISLCFLLGLGLLAAICGAIKIKFLAGFNVRSDFTWATYDLYIWTTSELFLVLFCACVPPLKPLYDRLSNRRSSSTWYTRDNTEALSFKLKRGYARQPESASNRSGSGDMTPHLGFDTLSKGNDHSQYGIEATTEIEISSQHESTTRIV